MDDTVDASKNHRTSHDIVRGFVETFLQIVSAQGSLALQLWLPAALAAS